MWATFYKTIMSISILLMLLVLCIILLINSYCDVTQPIWIDLKGILAGIFVGLFFSFLFTIRDIRSYLLKSISHYMADDSYLEKLNNDEVNRLSEKITNRIHGIDVVTNKESLFNYLKRLDRYLAIPHRSILNETLVYEPYKDDGRVFRVRRIQNFRIHTLDLTNHVKYTIKFKNYGLAESKDEYDEIVKQCQIRINVEGVIQDIPEGKLQSKFDEEKKRYHLDLNHEIDLKKEYTKVSIETTRIEPIDLSLAFYSNDATYGLNYDVVIPPEYSFVDVYHSNTMDLEKASTNINMLGNRLVVNIDRWQLPGLIFVAIYQKMSITSGKTG